MSIYSASKKKERQLSISFSGIPKTESSKCVSKLKEIILKRSPNISAALIRDPSTLDAGQILQIPLESLQATAFLAKSVYDVLITMSSKAEMTVKGPGREIKIIGALPITIHMITNVINKAIGKIPKKKPSTPATTKKPGTKPNKGERNKDTAKAKTTTKKAGKKPGVARKPKITKRGTKKRTN